MKTSPVSFLAQTISQPWTVSRSFTGDANVVFFTAISTPPAPNLLSFLFMISYPESDGNIAEW
jgi:hypothetical protein